jgi:hypothetical protein
MIRCITYSYLAAQILADEVGAADRGDGVHEEVENHALVLAGLPRWLAQEGILFGGQLRRPTEDLPHLLVGDHLRTIIWVRVEIMGAPKCRNIGESQSVLTTV